MTNQQLGFSIAMTLVGVVIVVIAAHDAWWSGPRGPQGGVA